MAFILDIHPMFSQNPCLFCFYTMHVPRIMSLLICYNTNEKSDLPLLGVKKWENDI